MEKSEVIIIHGRRIVRSRIIGYHFINDERSSLIVVIDNAEPLVIQETPAKITTNTLFEIRNELDLEFGVK